MKKFRMILRDELIRLLQDLGRLEVEAILDRYIDTFDDGLEVLRRDFSTNEIKAMCFAIGYKKLIMGLSPLLQVQGHLLDAIHWGLPKGYYLDKDVISRINEKNAVAIFNVSNAAYISSMLKNKI